MIHRNNTPFQLRGLVLENIKARKGGKRNVGKGKTDEMRGRGFFEREFVSFVL